jgi:hypothetical protein
MPAEIAIPENIRSLLNRADLSDEVVDRTDVVVAL